MITWLCISWIHEGKPSMTGALVGSVAGLATITPAAGYVNHGRPRSSVFWLAFVCYGAIQFRAKMGWDDALDVWGCHGVGGLLGVILTGVFASASVNKVSGLIEGNVYQFGVQVLAGVITAAFAFGMTWLILKIMNHFRPVRVPDEIEVKGWTKVCSAKRRTRSDRIKGTTWHPFGLLIEIAPSNWRALH